MSTKDYRTKNEIIINVGASSGGSTEAPVKRRGAAVPGSKQKKRHLPRRKTGQINFYDLGQMRSGPGWIDTDFSVVPPWLAAGTVLTPVRGPLLTDWTETRDAEILPIDRATWKTKFRKIVKNDQLPNYEIFLNWGPGGSGGDELSELENFTESGLSLTPAELADGLIVGHIGLLFSSGFTLHPDDDETGVKITETASFDADAVEFPLNPNMDIFLMPEFMFSDGESFGYSGIFNNGTVSFAIGVTQHLNNFYRNAPRSFVETGGPAAGSWSRFSGSTPAEYAAAYAGTVFARSLPFARVRTGADTFSPPNNVDIVWTAAAGASFPHPAIFPAPPGYPNEHAPPFPEAHFFDITFSQIDGRGWYNGVLLAVILTKSRWFYVWSNAL
jgi:hypothetical protein